MLRKMPMPHRRLGIFGLQYNFVLNFSYFSFFWGGSRKRRGRPGIAQGLLLDLCSGIFPGGTHMAVGAAVPPSRQALSSQLSQLSAQVFSPFGVDFFYIWLKSVVSFHCFVYGYTYPSSFTEETRFPIT